MYSPSTTQTAEEHYCDMTAELLVIYDKHDSA